MDDTTSGTLFWNFYTTTSCIERQNLTMRRFTRLTNALKSENHAHAVALRYVHYNFCRQSLRVTPAMAAGVAERLWEIADIVRLVEYAAPKRGPCKKRNSNRATTQTCYKGAVVDRSVEILNATVDRGLGALSVRARIARIRQMLGRHTIQHLAGIAVARYAFHAERHPRVRPAPTDRQEALMRQKGRTLHEKHRIRRKPISRIAQRPLLPRPLVRQ